MTFIVHHIYPYIEQLCSARLYMYITYIYIVQIFFHDISNIYYCHYHRIRVYLWVCVCVEGESMARAEICMCVNWKSVVFFTGTEVPFPQSVITNIQTTMLLPSLNSTQYVHAAAPFVLVAMYNNEHASAMPYATSLNIHGSILVSHMCYIFGNIISIISILGGIITGRTRFFRFERENKRIAIITITP